MADSFASLVTLTADEVNLADPEASRLSPFPDEASFAELMELRTNDVARGLRQRGVDPGDLGDEATPDLNALVLNLLLAKIFEDASRRPGDPNDRRWQKGQGYRAAFDELLQVATFKDEGAKTCEGNAPPAPGGLRLSR